MAAVRDCVFCGIVAGTEKAFEVLRTEHLLAFLDMRPLFPGHTLLVPAQHVRSYELLPQELAAEWLRTSQRLQRAVQRATQSPGSLLIVNNIVSQSVPHLHLHLIPRKPRDGLRLWLGPRVPYPDDAAASAMAGRIRAALEEA